MTNRLSGRATPSAGQYVLYLVIAFLHLLALNTHVSVQLHIYIYKSMRGKVMKVSFAVVSVLPLIWLRQHEGTVGGDNVGIQFKEEGKFP